MIVTNASPSLCREHSLRYRCALLSLRGRRRRQGIVDQRKRETHRHMGTV